jgi:hypothetical protein
MAVHQPFKPLWSRQLLHGHEPSRASFAVCFQVAAAGIGGFAIGLAFPQAPLFAYHFGLCGLGDAAGSNATADLALRVTETHQPLHHGKVG